MVSGPASADHKDVNISALPFSESSEFNVGHTYKSVFDLVRNGAVSDIESLVERLGAESLSSRDEWGYTPAHWAALDGNVEVMRYLVERSAPVDLPCLGTQGPRPIHWACRKGHTAVVQVLLQMKVGQLSVEIRKPDNNKLLGGGTLARFKVITAIADIGKLKNDVAKSKLALLAAQLITFSVKSQVYPQIKSPPLTAGVAVNAADFKGLTPLMTAAMFGRAASAAYLLGMDALNHLTDINGDSALHWASYKGHPDLIKLLMYSGIDLQKADNFGSTPLHLACLSGNVDCVKILCLKSKIDLEPRDKNGKTPLMLAKSHRHDDIVQVLNTEIMRRSRWMPPMSEIWNMLFGGVGDSKVPLVLFVVSVLFWEYPIYVLKCVPSTWDQLRGSHYVFIYWNLVMWLSWIVANRKNPGYIPQNSECYYRAIKQIPYYDKLKKREVFLSRLCHSCRCLRPLRAKHCRICNRCVAYFDHHCPFIHNCIGVKNRIWFLLFVLSVAINCTFTIYFSAYSMATMGFDLIFLVGMIESLVFCGLGWILTCTSVLHACMNLTTNEMFNYKRYPYLRDKRGKYLNPFSRGPLLNLIEFFVCTPSDSDEQVLLIEDSP